VTGAVLLKLIMLARNTFVALISSSIPSQPSYSDLYHLTPQVPLLWPVQDAAAAAPEVCSFAKTLSNVDGTSTAVNASHEEVSPLNRISLSLQVSEGSQLKSSMILPVRKNVSKVLFKSPLTAVCH
jgi:hypothetical protein